MLVPMSKLGVGAMVGSSVSTNGVGMLVPVSKLGVGAMVDSSVSTNGVGMLVLVSKLGVGAMVGSSVSTNGVGMLVPVSTLGDSVGTGVAWMLIVHKKAAATKLNERSFMVSVDGRSKATMNCWLLKLMEVVCEQVSAPRISLSLSPRLLCQTIP